MFLARSIRSPIPAFPQGKEVESVAIRPTSLRLVIIKHPKTGLLLRRRVRVDDRWSRTWRRFWIWAASVGVPKHSVTHPGLPSREGVDSMAVRAQHAPN